MHAHSCLKSLVPPMKTQTMKCICLNCTVEAIEKIIHLPGIIIEVVGHWIWVTGDTRPVKEQLKAAHFFFACKKLAWYFRADEYKTEGGKKSLEEIREKYGSEAISKQDKYKLVNYQ